MGLFSMSNKEKLDRALEIIGDRNQRIEQPESAIVDILAAYDDSAITTTVMMKAQQSTQPNGE